MSTVVPEPELVTRRGYERLRAELDHLVSVRRPQVAGELREARADGGEPGAVLDDQTALEQRIEELRATLAFARIADPPPDDRAALGQQVLLRLSPAASPRAYELVGPLECDPGRREISIDSPVGRALLGRRAGETVEVDTPAGARTVELLAVGRGG